MSGASDERGVSEGAGVAVLVLFTVLVTASVGMNALFLDSDSEGVQANFTFEYRGDASTLTVTHAEGDELNSSRLYFETQDTNVTWTALAGDNESFTVTQGDIVRLGESGAYGSPVSSSDTIEVVYVRNGNRTVLDTWSGEDSAFG